MFTYRDSVARVAARNEAHRRERRRPLTTEQKTSPLATGARRLGPFIAGFLGIQLFISAANSGIGGLLIPNRLAILDPHDKVALLGWTAGAAAIVTLIAAPIWGMLSDRTRGRFGRR